MAEKPKTVEQRAREYAFSKECKECLEQEAETCEKTATCTKRHITIIDYTAGFNDAVRVIASKNREL